MRFVRLFIVAEIIFCSACLCVGCASLERDMKAYSIAQSDPNVMADVSKSVANARSLALATSAFVPGGSPYAVPISGVVGLVVGIISTIFAGRKKLKGDSDGLVQ